MHYYFSRSNMIFFHFYAQCYAGHTTLAISPKFEDRAKVTINGLYKIVCGLLIAAKIYDLE